MRFRVLLSLMVIGSLAACNHYNYSPNLVATPYIVKKNESSLSANLGGLADGTTIDGQAVFNPWNKITLMANYFQAKNSFTLGNFSQQDNSHFFKSQYLEAAFGGWQQLGAKPFYFGCFLGAGAGRIRNEYGSQLEISKLRYSKAYLQPTFMYSGSMLRFGIATRLSRLAYQHGFIYTGIPYSDLSTLQAIGERSPFYLIEGGINAGIYLEGISFMANFVQVGQLGVKDIRSLREDYLFDVLNLSVGIGIDLHEFFYKKHKNKAKPGEPIQ